VNGSLGSGGFGSNGDGAVPGWPGAASVVISVPPVREMTFNVSPLSQYLSSD